jgi:hypothetical protein
MDHSVYFLSHTQICGNVSNIITHVKYDFFFFLSLCRELLDTDIESTTISHLRDCESVKVW